MRQLYSNCHNAEATRAGLPMGQGHLPKHHNCTQRGMSTSAPAQAATGEKVTYVNTAIHFNEEWDLQVQPEDGFFGFLTWDTLNVTEMLQYMMYLGCIPEGPSDEEKNKVPAPFPPASFFSCSTPRVASLMQGQRLWKNEQN